MEQESTTDSQNTQKTAKKQQERNILPQEPIRFSHSIFGRLFISSLILACVPAGVFLFFLPPRSVTIISFFMLLFFILIFALVCTFVLSLSITRPIAVLMEALRRISSGDFDARVPADRKDEIGRLARFFNATVDQFLEAQKRGVLVSDIKSQFVMVAAHQLRTPLSGMKWTFRLLLDGDMGDLSEKQREFLQQGFMATERMIRLVNDFLNISRIEEGKFGFHFAKIKIIDTLKKAVESSRAQAAANSITLTFESSVPEELLIIADEDRLYTVMMNLLDNAIRYNNPNGAVSVTAAEKDGMLEVRVADTGIGIPADEQQKIFSRFYRASNAIRRQTDGSGLGLYIVQSVIRHHGGDIRFSSEEGKGVEIFFTLPVKEDFVRASLGEAQAAVKSEAQ
ncbi:MAG: HAMP domain-containing sensor histidine kinase [Patescibacteria group bacterium]